MPCWYFERKEIKNSPSFEDGIDCATENRYRREGARFIIDAGTAMGLRYDTCATGVIYFHRFYMFHSFKEFYRYVTAACCLFLAGKVEETPKKCKDIIKVAQGLLSSRSFLKFGDDPREEVITMERILLKTIKFDLQVEHPYSFLLKYAKYFKDKDKEKTQKMAQMAWTFINDSLCTPLCLQWEPEIVAVSLMYLASRLTKFEPTDWIGRTSSKGKWWEDIIEGMSMELMEDICHQVLDLYSSKSKKILEDSPPPSPIKISKSRQSPPPPPPDKTPDKRSREATPLDPEPPVKSLHTEKDKANSKAFTSNVSTPTTGQASNSTPGAPIPVAQHITPTLSSHSSSYSSTIEPPGTATDSFTSYNPYVSSNMYTASFMSQEGSQNIQSILAGNSAPLPAQTYSERPLHHHQLPDTSQYPPTSAASAQYPYLPPPPQSQYTPPPSIPPPHSYPPAPSGPPNYDPYALPPPVSTTSYPPSTYAASLSLATTSQPQHSYPPPSLPPPPQTYTNYNYPPTHVNHPTLTHVPPPQLPPPPHQSTHYHSPMTYSSNPNPHQSYVGNSRHFPKSSGTPGSMGSTRKDIPALTEIKITGRPEWNLPP